MYARVPCQPGACMQEVKQAKQRHAQAKLPQPAHDGAAKRKAPDDCGLPDLPPGCRWGYCTPDHFFVPFDPSTRTMGSALPVAATDGTPTIATGGAAFNPPMHVQQPARLRSRHISALIHHTMY